MNNPQNCTSRIVFTLIFSLTLAAHGSGGILCLNENGQLQAELVCQPCCRGAGQECPGPPADDAHENHAECHNCSDIPRGQMAWYRRSPGRDAAMVNAADLGQSPLFAGLTGTATPSSRQSDRYVAASQVYASLSLSTSTAVLRC